MNINEKIEEIRKKPEHERIRYVWGMVAVSMFFIIILWGISLKDTFGNKNQTSTNKTTTSNEINLESITNSGKQ